VTVLEVMVRLHNCLKDRESGRPRSLAVGGNVSIFVHIIEVVRTWPATYKIAISVETQKPRC
jgi:hypothetical protein